MLWMSSSAQASWRASSGDCPRSARRPFGAVQMKERDSTCHLRSTGPRSPGRNTSWSSRWSGPAAAWSWSCRCGCGGDGEGDEPGGGVRQPAACGSRCRGGAGPHAVRFGSMTVPAVGRARTVLKGTDFAPFLTRQARSAPLRRTQPPVHGEEPAVGQVQHPGPNVASSWSARRSRRRGSRRARRRSTGRCGAHVRGGPQQRPRAVRGRAERVFQHAVPGQFHRGAVQRGDLQALPQHGDAQLSVGRSASSSKALFMTCSPSSFRAWENALWPALPCRA